ncbi:hypothetical protein HYU22_01860 [Candidatus Woesearchaeota archaeon]|nr:hypothetical protein [Candidatus Woesearchaeota archaeon]
MEHDILFRAVIEVLGKPKEHVESSIKEYVAQLKQNPKYKVIREDAAEVQQQGESELWTIFTELEIKTEKVEDVVAFCFNYMPALLEILEPRELTMSDAQLSLLLNDLQSKLHQVDMIAKQSVLEREHLQQNMGRLLKNYVTVLLRNGSLSSLQLGKLTGMEQDKMEDFLDQLIDEGKVDLKEGVYFLKEKN